VHFPLAFSIHHFVSSVGADAGFAAIVGLAILVLLYFAQARETSSLRDQSISASERVAELERRLALLGSSPGRPVSGVKMQEPAAPEPLPAAPAGVAAPALAAATRVVPIPQLPRPAYALATASTASPAGAPAAAASPAAAAGEARPAPSPSVTPPPVPITPAPATVAASRSAAPSLASRPPVPAGPAQTGSNGTGEHNIAQPGRVAGTAAARPRRVKISPGASVAAPPRSPLRPGARLPASRRWLPAAVVVVLAIVAVVALLIVTSSGGNPQPAASSRTTNALTGRPKSVFKPSAVTVAVLNGTDVAGVAHKVASKLSRAGYKQGMVGNASSQTQTATAVGYVGKHRGAAIHVAKALGLSSGAVAPANQSAEAVACPPPSSSCSAEVIVTVGTDLSNTP
jgi:hypothetical protein